MPLELFEDEFGDPRNAQVLAVAADIAYFPAEQGIAVFQEQFGMKAGLISAGNTQAYVAHNDAHLLVAFRGTEAPTSIEGLKDWLLTDAVNLIIQPEGDIGTDFAAAGVGTRWHQGFIRALDEIWAPVFAAVDAERKNTTGRFGLPGIASAARWRCWPRGD